MARTLLLFNRQMRNAQDVEVKSRSLISCSALAPRCRPEGVREHLLLDAGSDRWSPLPVAPRPPRPARPPTAGRADRPSRQRREQGPRTLARRHSRRCLPRPGGVAARRAVMSDTGAFVQRTRGCLVDRSSRLSPVVAHRGTRAEGRHSEYEVGAPVSRIGRVTRVLSPDRSHPVLKQSPYAWRGSSPSRLFLRAAYSPFGIPSDSL